MAVEGLTRLGAYFGKFFFCRIDFDFFNLGITHNPAPGNTIVERYTILWCQSTPALAKAIGLLALARTGVHLILHNSSGPDESIAFVDP